MKKRKPKRIRLVLLMLTLTLSAVADAGPEEYAVVINASNSYRDDLDAMRRVVRQLFLKQRTEWPASNITVKPFSRLSDSPEQRAFREAVLHMSDAELADHWISLKQRTGQAAPREISRDSLLLRLVSRFEGGLAVVSRQTAEEAGPEVKILFLFSE